MAFHAGEITDTVESIKCFSNFRFSILIVIYNCILKYVDFLFDSIEHQKLDIFKELCQNLYKDFYKEIGVGGAVGGIFC
jgi:hypothetical protein